MPLTTYVPDPDKWVRYFEDVASGKSHRQDNRPEVIPIEDIKEWNPEVKQVHIVPVTPVQHMNDRIQSELRRIGALKNSSKLRKKQHEKIRAQSGGSMIKQLKRVSKRDTSGF